MYEYRVKKVIAIVDGDTIDVDIDLGFDISFYSRVRLAGIDTPESRTKDKEEKILGLEVKERLKKLLSEAKTVVIKTEKPDSTEKYGRVLGWLYIDGAEQSVTLGHIWETQKLKILMPFCVSEKPIKKIKTSND